jgi:chorismate mutase
MFCDPSHITGDARWLKEIAQKGLDLDMDGLMIESHVHPQAAWSDAKQQITGAELRLLLDSLIVRGRNSAILDENPRIELLRNTLDETDLQIIRLLARRMATVEEIGKIKFQENLPILQIKRWQTVIHNLLEAGTELGISEEVVRQLYNLIHDASIKRQEQVFAAISVSDTKDGLA